MNISEIKNEFSHASREEWESLIQKHISDERSGVQSIIKTYQNKIKKYELEIERLEKMHERRDN